MKETRQQIIENTKKQVRKEYSQRIKELETRLNNSIKSYYSLLEEIGEYKDENARLKNEIEKYEDWNKRLQSYVDLRDELGEEKFKEYLESEKRRNSITDRLAKFINLGLYI